MLRTHRAGKGPGGCGVWGLGSRNRRGPGVPPTPGLRGQGTSPRSPAGFLGSSGWGKCPPLLLLQSGRAPTASFSWSPWPPSYALKNPRGLEGALEGRGSPWELSRLPGLSRGAVALCSSPALPGESFPPASPDLPGLRGTDPVWPPLLLPPQSPYILLVHFGVPPVSLGVSPPAAGRRPSCGETLTLHLPTLPSWLRPWYF